LRVLARWQSLDAGWVALAAKPVIALVQMLGRLT
jgi:hypothetical protein